MCVMLIFFLQILPLSHVFGGVLEDLHPVASCSKKFGPRWVS